VPDDCLKPETNGRTIKLVLLLHSFRLIISSALALSTFCSCWSTLHIWT